MIDKGLAAAGCLGIAMTARMAEEAEAARAFNPWRKKSSCSQPSDSGIPDKGITSRRSTTSRTHGARSGRSSVTRRRTRSMDWVSSTPGVASSRRIAPGDWSRRRYVQVAPSISSPSTRPSRCSRPSLLSWSTLATQRTCTGCRLTSLVRANRVDAVKRRLPASARQQERTAAQRLLLTVENRDGLRPVRGSFIAFDGGHRRCQAEGSVPRRLRDHPPPTRRPTG